MNPLLIIAIVASLAAFGLWRILAAGRKLRARREQEQRRRVAEQELELADVDDDETRIWPGPEAMA